MLRALHIQNIALIEKLDLDLEYGLNILSGETGAGKSIIIDSLNFVLGERADKTLIRHNQEYAIVEALFENYQNEEVNNCLNEVGIEISDQLIIYRKMSFAGKNECRVNGRLINVSMLKKITSLLCDIHGQHEHQSLLNVDTHIDLVDMFDKDEIFKIKSKYIQSYNNYKDIKCKLSKFTGSENRLRKMDILSYQINEIEDANLQIDEEEELKQNIKKLSNIEKIATNLNSSIEILDKGEFAVNYNITKAYNDLLNITEYDEELNELAERLNSCQIELEDISSSLIDKTKDMDFDANEVEKLEDRLALIRRLERKYGKTIEDVLKFYDNCKKEYEFLENSEQTILKLEKELKNSLKIVKDNAKLLTNQRKCTSKKLVDKIQKELNDLGMKNAKFVVDFDESYDNLTENGNDKIEFLISTNAGEPVKPLAKIISGGEMSRFMLAIKNILAEIDQINTMVFDEIDTGISGKIAQVVAQKLYNISRNRQVIAVTHLPQLTSMADKHYLIEKSTKNNQTNTHIYLLNYEESIKEIARLAGGDDYSEFGILHAKEMKEWSNKYKAKIN